MITHEELKSFQEYIQNDNLKINIEINNQNQILTSIIWYELDENKMLNVQYSVCPATRSVVYFQGIKINYDIIEFFKMMTYWEHEFYINDLGSEAYNFFDYSKDKWSVSKKG